MEAISPWASNTASCLSSQSNSEFSFVCYLSVHSVPSFTGHDLWKREGVSRRLLSDIWVVSTPCWIQFVCVCVCVCVFVSRVCSESFLLVVSAGWQCCGQIWWLDQDRNIPTCPQTQTVCRVLRDRDIICTLKLFVSSVNTIFIYHVIQRLIVLYCRPTNL